MLLNKMFLISGNNTGTGILQNIIDSDGTGLICESEADTISTVIGSEYGHRSDTMRKAFDHGLAYTRTCACARVCEERGAPCTLHLLGTEVRKHGVNLYASSANLYTAFVNLYTTSVNLYTASVNLYTASVNLYA